MSDEIKVSIICFAYNQEKYIRDCLDGFMMQKTNFKFEVLINDDASTDGTADIIREYEKNYPDIIKPIYQAENQWSKGLPIGATFLYPKIKGKYMAMCEGDDYWTDPYKLQKQVDFMEANPDYTVCFHDVQVIHEPKIKEDYIFPTDELKKQFPTLNFENILIQNFIQTNSVMYRTSSYPDFWKYIPSNITPGDWYLHLMFASKGNIKYMPEVMSVYRRNPGGIFSNAINNMKKHVCKFGMKETNMRYQVYKNIAKSAKDKKECFVKNLFPFFMNQQFFILASLNFSLWLRYNINYFIIYLLCFKYWYCMPKLTIKILENYVRNIRTVCKQWNN